MGIYSNVVFNNRGDDSPIITDTIESIMEDSSIVMKDENEDFVSEGLDIISTITENYNNFMQRVGISELSAIYATGDEMIYTENVVTDFLGGIKKFLMKIWEKIKSLFKRFIMVIDSYTKKDKAFINKYRQQIYRHKSLSDFTFKGYQYTIEQSEIDGAMKALSDKTKEYIDDNGSLVASGADYDAYGSNDSTFSQDTASKYDEKHDDRMETLRGLIVSKFTKGGGKAGKYTAEEYRKEIEQALRHGEEEKEELTDKEIDVDGMVTELQNSTDTKKKINDTFKQNKRIIDDNIKAAERLQKEHIRDNMPSKGEDDEVTDERADKMTDDEIIKYVNKVTASTNKASSVSTSDGATDMDDIGNDGKIKKANAIAYIKTKKGNLTSFDRSNSKRTAARLNNAVKVTNATKTMLVTLDTCILKALKERSRQYKACLVKIVYHNPKNESSFTESYDYDSNYGFNNYISSIEFK